VPISVEPPSRTARKIKRVTFIVDENRCRSRPLPLPPTIATARRSARYPARPCSPIRVLVEASDGALYYERRNSLKHPARASVPAAAGRLDPVLAASTIGQMKLTDLPPRTRRPGDALPSRGAIDIRHPAAHRHADEKIRCSIRRCVLSMRSRCGRRRDDLRARRSMTLSENPRIRCDYQINGARAHQVTTKDTSETVVDPAIPAGSNSLKYRCCRAGNGA